MARFVTLYSGSSGNATLIGDEDVSLLVDMGKSCRQTLESLVQIGEKPKNIRAILLTHEHSDHIGGLHTFLKKYKVPVFGAGATLEYLTLNDLVPDNAHLIDINTIHSLEIGGITVESFATSHDSAACLGYRFCFENGSSVALATDLGVVTDDVHKALCGSTVVALESNYDRLMLETGYYPRMLKRRIGSRLGHLSNDDCAAMAVEVAKSGTRQLVLMHLSEENNLPDLALTTCLARLEDCGLSASIKVSVAPRHSVGEVIEV